MLHLPPCRGKFPHSSSEHFRLDFKCYIFPPVVDAKFDPDHFRDYNHFPGFCAVEFFPVGMDISEQGFLGFCKASFQCPPFPCSQEWEEFLHVHFLDLLPVLSLEYEFCHNLSLPCPPGPNCSNLPSWRGIS